MFARIKVQLTIHLNTEPASADEETKPIPLETQQSVRDDELQDMLDDYD